MNITAKIIITDTNIITDLSNAGVLEKFIELDNVFVSDLVKMCKDTRIPIENIDDLIQKYLLSEIKVG